MKKNLFVLIFIFISVFNLHAAYYENLPITVKQPNGLVVNCFITGDEFYNWAHDANNYTIIQNHATGYWVYAKLQNDQLVPSQFITGVDDPLKTNLKPGVNIPVSAIRQLRTAYLQNAPAKGQYTKYGSKRATVVLNNIVIFIRFSGEAEFTDDTSLYWNMFNKSTAGYNSMKNYFQEASYNQLIINSTMYPKRVTGSIVLSYQDAHTRDYFQPFDATTNPNGYSAGNATSREQTLLENAVNAVKSQIPAGIDFDYNSDGNIDNICFIVSGATTAWNTLLWPHRWSLYSSTVTINGLRVWDYNFQLQDHLKTSGVGVLCHEMFHTLGAPDLYHYSMDGKTPVGPWDIMGGSANPPMHMLMFMKFKYGNWLSSIPEIKSPGTYHLHPNKMNYNNCYKIASPDLTQYFVLEYRKNSGTFDATLPGSGLIIYRINTFAGSGNASGPPDEVYVYRPGGDTSVNGTINTAFFNLPTGRTVFNNTSDPACFLANTSPGDLDIYNITSPDTTISFSIRFAGIPVANFSIGKTCSGQITQFTNTSTVSSTILHLYWSLDNDNVFNDSIDKSTASKIFSTPGTYMVGLIMETLTGSDTVRKTITIDPSPIPGFNINAVNQPLATNNFIVTNTSTISPIQTLTTKWDFGDGFKTNTDPANYSYATTGIKSIKLVVATTKMCKDSIYKNVIVYLPGVMIPDFIFDTVCFGDTTTLINTTITSNPILRLEWALDNDSLFNDNLNDSIVKHVFTLTGSIAIGIRAYTIIDTQTTFRFITTHPKPSALFVINQDSQLVYSNNYIFTNQSTILTPGIIATNTWFYGDGGFSFMPNPNYSYTVAGDYDVKLVVTSNQGCKDSILKKINVKGVLLNISFLYSNNCLGDTVRFTNTSTVTNDTILLWLWDFGDGFGSNLKDPVHYYAVPGTYQVKLIALTVHGYKDSIIIPVTINSKPVINYTLTGYHILHGDTLCIYDTYTLEVKLNGTWDSINWFTGEHSQSVILQKTGVYTVLVYDTNGCQSDTVILLNVLPRIPMKFRNTITPNNDGINDLWRILNIEMYQPAILVIYNRNGIEIYSDKDYKNNWDGTFKGDLLPQGTYYYIIETKDHDIIKGAINVLR